MTPAIQRALATLWAGVTGLTIGSFLNVVIYRVPLGFRVTLPSRSACRTCKRKLAWYENVPVLSFLFLKGRCRGCHARISFRYPLVEFMTALLFVAVLGRKGLTFASVYYSVFCAALIAITFIDLDHRIIPDAISLPFIPLGIIGSLAVPSLGIVSSTLGAAAGGLGLWFTAWAYERSTGREGLGLGDVKMIAMIGAFLGPWGALATVLISSLYGSLIGLSLMVVHRKGLRMALPYGPFLAMGSLTWIFWGDVIALHFFP